MADQAFNWAKKRVEGVNWSSHGGRDPIILEFMFHYDDVPRELRRHIGRPLSVASVWVMRVASKAERLSDWLEHKAYVPLQVSARDPWRSYIDEDLIETNSGYYTRGGLDDEEA